MKKNDHLFLVDGSGYIFRAYHALPPLTRKSDGLPVGAVAGFCNMLWKLLKDARNTAAGIVPTHFAVIFDYSSQTFRKEIYPDYKANRSAPPEDLIPQFALIRQATRAFNLPCIEMEGYEADDLIATYARLAKQADMDVTIISSDKDLMQLVDDHVSMYDSMKDRQIGVQEVIDKWGVPPEKMIDLQSLTGDSTDNIPGIPGIGPKTAAQLLEEYGSVDNLIANADKIKQPKRRENIVNFAEQTKIARQLVTLKDDVAVEHPLNEFVLQPQNGPKLIGFLKAMEFNTLTRRVADATDTDAAHIDPAHIELSGDSQLYGPDMDEGDEQTLPQQPVHESLAAKRQQQALADVVDHDAYITIKDTATLAQWIAMAEEQGYLAFDTETTALDPMQAQLVGFSMGLDSNKAAYVPLAHKSATEDLLGGGVDHSQIDFDQALKLLKPLLEDAAVLKIGQNIKYDYLILQQLGIEIVSYDDTMLMSYVLDAGRGNHSMDVLSEKWLGHKPISFKEVAGSGRNVLTFDLVDISKASIYAAEDADVTLRLWKILKPRLIEKGLDRIYQRLERPLVKVLANMESRGICIDRQILSRLSGEIAQSAGAIEHEIYQLAGEKFNIGSPKQLGDILFDKMNFEGGSKTRTGQWSTSAQKLEDLAAQGHELPRKIVDWRQLTKLKSTYTDALPNYINPHTGRVHTNYSMAGTSTGRLASSEPNLQNIPIRTSEGRKIRKAFIAADGNKLISADYSQIELRVLAHVADITALKQAFADNIDIHAMTASEMFHVPLKDMPSEIRRRAKAINFGIIYGISAFGLANQLGIGREEAGNYIRTYFERFPGIKDYMETTKTFARENGYVETIFGRRINFPEIRASNAQVRAFNERAAINAPIQGSASDIIRRAMIKMETALDDKKLDAKMLLQVHDELVFEAPDDEVDKTIDVIINVMENAALPALDLKVPLKVEARAAANWDEAH